jgi:hypothetical protein
LGLIRGEDARRDRAAVHLPPSRGIPWTLRKCLFSVAPLIPARISFRIDHRKGVVTVALTNVDRLERVTLEFASSAIEEPVLEDFVRLMLGHDSAFLRRAPLAGLRGRGAG